MSATIAIYRYRAPAGFMKYNAMFLKKIQAIKFVDFILTLLGEVMELHAFNLHV